MAPGAVASRRTRLDELGRLLGIKMWRDWLEVTPERFLGQDRQLEEGGPSSAILLREHGSMGALLAALYPEAVWWPWRFASPPQAWTRSPLALDGLDAFLHGRGVLRYQAIYEVRWGAYRTSLGPFFRGHVTSLRIKDAFPAFPWRPWLFPAPPSAPYRRPSLDDHLQGLGVQRFAALSSLPLKVLAPLAPGLLKRHANSPYFLFKSIYPEIIFFPWRFVNPPKRLSDSPDPALIPLMLSDVERRFGVQMPSDWYRVSQLQLRSYSPAIHRTVKAAGGLSVLLTRFYPDQIWQPSLFSPSLQARRSSQRALVVAVRRLFPETVIEEEWQPPLARYPESGAPMRFDVAVPSRSLVFEYQGQLHLLDSDFFGPAQPRQRRDEEKRRMTSTLGLRLIEVPFYWDGTPTQLLHLMDQER